MSKLNFDSLLANAEHFALQYRHEFITSETLLMILARDDSRIRDIIQKTGGNPDNVVTDIINYFDNTMPKGGNRTIELSLAVQRLIVEETAKKMASNDPNYEANHDSIMNTFVAIVNDSESNALQILMNQGVDKTALMQQIKNDKDEMHNAADMAVLEEFCTNLNEQAKNNKITPLIGRDKELVTLAQTLARMKKNNAILVGEAGVGKTAIGEGLAYNIVNGDVKPILLDATVWQLDVAGLIAGARYRGDFEERLKSILSALGKTEKPILFIDEIHSIVSAGAGGGENGSAMNLGNLLKGALQDTDIRFVGTTTADEYRKHLEKDKALVRRFKKIQIVEPTIEECKEILRGIAPSYEKYHNVKYDLDGLDTAVELTSKYIHDKQLPDKAIDVMDGVAARYRAGATDNIEKEITVEMIEEEIGAVAHIQTTTIKESEENKILNLEANIKKKVFGQDDAVQSLVDSIRISKAGLLSPDRPIGNFLAVGPTGVGKTEVAKQLAEEMGVELVRFDMSEFMEKHSASKFVGTTAGYVGYEEEGQLIKAIDDNPGGCVLLLDEIEKANPDIFNLLLQVMDAGRLTSGKGKTVNFKNVVLIMTSNAGSADAEKNSLGFMTTDSNTESTQTDALNKLLAPEFRNRLDATLHFNKLSEENIGHIVDKFIGELNVLAGNRNVAVQLSEEAKEWLVEHGYEPTMGARPMARLIQSKIKKPLSIAMLHGSLKDGGTFNVTVKDDDLITD